MDAEIRTAARASDLQTQATALLRAGDRDGAGKLLQDELRRLELETVAVHKAIDTRLLNVRVTRAADDEIPGLVARKLALLDEQLAVVERLTDLGWHFPR